MPYHTIPKGATLKPKKYHLEIPQQDVDHFYQLLKLSTLAPKTYENTRSDPNLFGVSHDMMSKAKQEWETKYDWRSREAYINSFPNYTVQLKDNGDEFMIHFAALFSDNVDAIPIVLMHGWPGSFLEFLGLLSAAKKKYTSDKLPYHLIVPSLPGYTLSSGPPLDKDFKTEDIARIMNSLMVGLGFSSYCAQGGDIGSYTTRPLFLFKECKAIHLNFSMMNKPKGNYEVTNVEKKGLERAEDFSERASAYALEHGTRPATIGFVLQSSPLALLAWIYEKFETWTDTTPPLTDILDSVTLYWFTRTIPRCLYPYREYHGALSTHGGGGAGPHSNPKYHILQPLGYSYFPMELAPMPISWVKQSGNLVWSKVHDAGGHFAALEKPEVLFADIEEFLGEHWFEGKAGGERGTVKGELDAERQALKDGLLKVDV